MIERFNKHLNKIFSSYKKNDKIMDFKEELLGSLMDRFNELKSEGLSDDESYTNSLLILDGIKDTISVLEKEVAPMPVEKNMNSYLLPACAYWLVVIIAYLGISFTTGYWHKTWMIAVGGALLFGIIVSGLLFKVSRDKGMKLLSRSNMLMAFMLLSTAVYLGWSFITKQWAYTWITFVIGLLLWYVVDIFVRVKEKKGKVIVNLMDAIIVTILTALIIYIFISFYLSLWATSWIIFVIMALFIIIEIMIFNKK